MFGAGSWIAPSLSVAIRLRPPKDKFSEMFCFFSKRLYLCAPRRRAAASSGPPAPDHQHPVARLSGCGAVGSASGLGPEGRMFESCHPDWEKAANAPLFSVGVTDDPPAPPGDCGAYPPDPLPFAPLALYFPSIQRSPFCRPANASAGRLMPTPSLRSSTYLRFSRRFFPSG